MLPSDVFTPRVNPSTPPRSPGYSDGTGGHVTQAGVINNAALKHCGYARLIAEARSTKGNSHLVNSL